MSEKATKSEAMRTHCGLVSGHCILIGVHAAELENLFHPLTIDTFVRQIQKHLQGKAAQRMNTSSFAPNDCLCLQIQARNRAPSTPEPTPHSSQQPDPHQNFIPFNKSQLSNNQPTCFAYDLNSGVTTSRSATDIPQMVWLCGPPCNPAPPFSSFGPLDPPPSHHPGKPRS